MPTIPKGFRPSERSSNYMDLIGPLYETEPGRDYRLGLRVDERHVNNRGFCHGGVLAALADVSLGRILAISETPRVNLITMNVNIDYLAAAGLGQWLEATGRIDRKGKRVAHSSGMILADGEPVARTSGIFMGYPRGD